MSSTSLYGYAGYCLTLRPLRLRKVLPTFVIIGAQKAGTTSLHEYLGQHPEIFMSHGKETQLFLDDSPDRGPYGAIEAEFYGCSNRKKRGGLSDNQILRRMLQGYGGERVVGEASPYYTTAPSTGLEAPANILRRQPGAKLIYILRNPLQRMVSNYLHDRMLYERIGRPIDVDLSAYVNAMDHVLSTSLYHYQLSRFLECFDSSSIRVITLEDLVRDPQGVLEGLVRFVGARPGHAFDTGTAYNASAARGAASADSLKFDHATYSRVMRRLGPDLDALGRVTSGVIGQWDVSATRWCR